MALNENIQHIYKVAKVRSQKRVGLVASVFELVVFEHVWVIVKFHLVNGGAVETVGWVVFGIHPLCPTTWAIGQTFTIEKHRRATKVAALAVFKSV
jgi:CBS domain containing-hemolysin-like protein